MNFLGIPGEQQVLGFTAALDLNLVLNLDLNLGLNLDPNPLSVLERNKPCSGETDPVQRQFWFSWGLEIPDRNSSSSPFIHKKPKA